MSNLIRQRFTPIGVEAPETNDEEWQASLPFLMAAMNCHFNLMKVFFEKTSLEAVAETRLKYSELNEEQYGRFLEFFPDRFVLPESLKKILPGTINTLSKDKADVQSVINTIVELFKHGADVTPVMLDSSLSTSELNAYLEAGFPADSNIEGYSTLHAAFPQSTEYFGTKMKMLLAHGVNPNHLCKMKGFEVGTFLHVVIANEADQWILEAIDQAEHFDPSLTDGENKTILITAAKSRNFRAVKKILVSFGERGLLSEEILNHRDESGRTAMHYSYAYGAKDCIEVLQAAGASENITDDKGLKPQDYLFFLTKEDIRDMLVSIEIDPDRDIRAYRNVITDWAMRPITFRGQYIASSKDNLLTVGNFSIQDYNIRGQNSDLYKHCKDVFMANRTARLVCASRHEPLELSIQRECNLTIDIWQKQLNGMAGISVIDGIGILRDAMRQELKPSSGNVTYFAKGKGVVFAPSI